jgi:hypothetical protein
MLSKPARQEGKPAFYPDLGSNTGVTGFWGDIIIPGHDFLVMDGIR